MNRNEIACYIRNPSFGMLTLNNISFFALVRITCCSLHIQLPCIQSFPSPSYFHSQIRVLGLHMLPIACHFAHHLPHHSTITKYQSGLSIGTDRGIFLGRPWKTECEQLPTLFGVQIN